MHHTVRYGQCFSASTSGTLCTPARASVITGTYPHKHGLEKVIYPAGFPGKIPTKHPEGLSNPFHDNRFMLWDNFPVYLHNSGYETAHIGKWHLGPGNPGFFDTWKTYNSLMPHWIGEPFKSTYREDIETDEGIRFIERNADRPFFLYQSFYNPHAPFEPPYRFQDLYKNVDIDHKDYYATVSSVDENIGRLIDTLKTEDVFDETLIIITADHGGGFQERAGSFRGMGVAYDEAARIPMIMHWPKGLPAGVQWQSGISLVDIAPTILSAAGIRTENKILQLITGRSGSIFHGQNLITKVNSGKDDWDRPVFMQNIPEAAIERSRFDERAMRSRRWKVIFRDFHDTFGVQKNELYDMEADPHETKNLYYDLAYRQPLEEELRLMLYWSELNEDELAIKLTRKELSTSGNLK